MKSPNLFCFLPVTTDGFKVFATEGFMVKTENENEIQPSIQEGNLEGFLGGSPVIRRIYKKRVGEDFADSFIVKEFVKRLMATVNYLLNLLQISVRMFFLLHTYLIRSRILRIGIFECLSACFFETIKQK